MSGIVGIVNLDGAPVDRDLLVRMTDFMTYRGPDAQQIWIDGNVGFGHTMLRTTFEAETEHQPLTLDGKVWLTADARIDGRTELISELEAKLGTKLRVEDRSTGNGNRSSNGNGNGNGSDSRLPNDAELILYAYRAWSEDCVKHLIGDFAFAIWDSRNRRLFCARDHFGVKPFFYVLTPNTLIVSNTLKSVLLHNRVTDRLNDLAIADFLIFGSNQDSTTTCFADISRLPPAHRLNWRDGRFSSDRYWILPSNVLLNYKRPHDYIDHFKEEFRAAVNDRLRSNRIGVFMSGGLDSTAVAAAAKDALSVSEDFDLRAYTVVYDRLIPDRERYYSGLAADALKIQIHYLSADEYKPYERWNLPELDSPEPYDDPVFPAIGYDQYCQVSANSRVVLTGYGGDPVLLASPRYLSQILRERQLRNLFASALQFIRLRRRIPPFGFRTFIKQVILGPQERWHPPYPNFVDIELENRLRLRTRWNDLTSESMPNGNPTRPEAYRELASPLWANIFGFMDPSVTSTPVEVRHPFFDVRLVSFLLAVPPLPWCLDKTLLRAAMHHVLPEKVRMRAKTPLAGDPLVARMEAGEHVANTFVLAKDLRAYVDVDTLTLNNQGTSSDGVWLRARAGSLSYWLQNRETIRYNSNHSLD